MVNFICGMLGMIVFTLFIGGLGYSIWESTGFFAFPVIVAIVLAMAYAAFIGELKSGTDHT